MRLRRRRLWGRVALGVVVVAAVAAGTVTVRQLLDLEDRKERADAAALAARGDEADVDARAADLEALIVRLGEAEEGHRTTTQHLQDTMADITALRGAIDDLAADLELARADRTARQGRLDLLLRCRDALDAVVAEIDGTTPTPDEVALLLQGGRTRCQEALALVQGDTGAVHPYDFPDPSVLLVGDTYFAYATEGPGGPVQVMTSTNLRSWEIRPTALANLPEWARPGSTWAPTVHAIGGRYVLYYAVRTKATGRLCLSSAVGAAPGGPFLDDSAAPLVCQDGLGGSIDPSVYLDPFGFAHLTWKSEDETVGGVSHLWTQYLSGDGRKVVGVPAVLLRAEASWEDDVIENPSMVLVDGTWILLYAGNRWNTADYGMGHAICASAIGPCQRPPSSKLLGSRGGFEGPGGAHAFTTRGGRTAVAYAAWDRGNIGYPNPRRLHVATITFQDGELRLEDI